MLKELFLRFGGWVLRPVILRVIDEVEREAREKRNEWFDKCDKTMTEDNPALDRLLPHRRNVSFEELQEP